MKQKLQNKARQIASHPKVRQSVRQMKPAKTVWGFLGVVFFFIAPEIVAFIWGADITAYAHAQMLKPPSTEFEALWYEGLIMMFEDGGSWLNLGIGFGLLAWLFY